MLNRDHISLSARCTLHVTSAHERSSLNLQVFTKAVRWGPAVELEHGVLSSRMEPSDPSSTAAGGTDLLLALEDFFADPALTGVISAFAADYAAEIQPLEVSAARCDGAPASRLALT